MDPWVGKTPWRRERLPTPVFWPGEFRGLSRASLVAQMVKNLPATQETQVRSLGREDPLEKEMAAHSSTLAWKIPWMEEPGRLQSMGSQRVGPSSSSSRQALRASVTNMLM